VRGLYKYPSKVGAVFAAKDSGWRGLFRKKNGEVDVNKRIELGREGIQNFITALDAKYWDSSAIVARPGNAKSALLFPSASLGAGVAKKGWLNAFQPGAAAGFNKINKNVFIDLYVIREKYSRSYTYAGTANLGIRGGYRTEVTTQEPGFQAYDEIGTAVVLPIGEVYFSQNSFMFISGLGFEASMLIPAFQYFELYEVNYRRRGYRWNFKLPEFLCRKLLTKNDEE